MSEITLELHDLKSTVRGEEVPTAVVLPSGYEDQKEPLPLLISLHGTEEGKAETTLSSLRPSSRPCSTSRSCPPRGFPLPGP